MRHLWNPSKYHIFWCSFKVITTSIKCKVILMVAFVFEYYKTNSVSLQNEQTQMLTQVLLLFARMDQHRCIFISFNQVGQKRSVMRRFTQTVWILHVLVYEHFAFSTSLSSWLLTRSLSSRSIIFGLTFWSVFDLQS